MSQSESLDPPPFEVRHELAGWRLLWALLERREAGADEEERLAGLRRTVAQEARVRFSLDELARDPTVAALRRLFKAAGCDPSRYRPSAEALLRRLLKGDELPVIDALVDLNNCLSTRLAVPCCVMAEGSSAPPYVLRSGREGESYVSLRGPFRLEGKPLLVDRDGPCDTPITGSERVKVKQGVERAWLVAYLPAEVVTAETARDELVSLLQRAPVARILACGFS